MFLFKKTSVKFAFLETESMWVGQERLSEIVTPDIWPRGLILRQCREVCIWSGWDIWLLWYVGPGIWTGWSSAMSHRFSHISRAWRSFCKVIDSPSKLIARYMTVSSSKSLTLDLTWSGRSFIYARKSMGPRTEPCGTQEYIAIWLHLKQQLENENPKGL